jgi:transposase-like protein
MSTKAAEKYLQDNPDATITSVAKLFGVNRSTLSRHARGVTMARDEYLRNCDRKLTIVQETRLVKHINVLTNRGYAPSHQMVRRFAQEIGKKSVGKNWPRKFVKRHSNILASGFLDAIELSRKMADSAKSYQRWFDQVFN